jgi:hypothetical protein
MSESITAILPTDDSTEFEHVVVAVETDIPLLKSPVLPSPVLPSPPSPPILPHVEQTDITPLIESTMPKQVDTFISLLPSASKFSVNLTISEISVITAFLNDVSGTIIPQIKSKIQELLITDTISLHDIPKVVLLITQLVQSKLFAVKNINLLNVIKYIMDSLIDSKILPIPSGLESAAKSIVDTSIELLNITLPEVEDECCTIFSFLSCFSCKK